MNTAQSMMPPAEAFALGHVPAPARRFDGDRVSANTEQLIEEVPVSLEWNGTRHVVMMATPTDLEAFAIGFSITEGIVEHAGQISAIDVVPTAHGVGVLIRIPEARAARAAARERLHAGSGSCGLCGIRDLHAAVRLPARLADHQVFNPAAIVAAMCALPDWQTIGAATGAAHAAGFASPSGAIELVCEDAGRHNALDKLIGKLAQAGRAPAGGFLVLTSRASFEMVQKAATAGFPMLCAISAPTGLAVRMADEIGMTLVAFARGDRFTCFSHPRRIASAAVD